MLISCFMFTGCTKNELEGSYIMDLDFSEQINSGFAGSDLEEYIKIETGYFTYIAKFNADGTYSFDVVDQSLVDMIDSVRLTVADGMRRYYKMKLLEADSPLSVDEFLEQQNIDLDAVAKDAFSDAMVEEMIGSLENEGYYTAKDGKLCMSESLDTRPDPEVYEEYTLEGDTLTITAGSTENETEEGIYPLVFKKTN